MNSIERLKELVAAGANVHAAQQFASKALAGCKAGDVAESDLDAANSAVIASNREFAIKAANARQALSDVLALVDAVREWRMFQSEETEAALMRTYDALTSADAQEVGE